jgi:predicted CXXCH cytochrome family protein
MLNLTGKEKAVLGAAMLLFAVVALCLPGGAGAAKRTFKQKGCLSCHEEFVQTELSKKTVHTAVKEEKCESCHLKHGIVPKLLLTKQGNDLCFQCHSAEALQLDQGKVHSALKWGKCVSCHDPPSARRRSMPC